MRVLGACIYEQVAKQIISEARLGEHTLHSSPDEFSGSLLEDLLGCRETLSSGVSGIARIDTVSHLPAAEGDLLGVDYDDIVTAVDVRGEPGLVLATKNKGHAGRETTKSEISSVNDDPLLVNGRLVQRYRFVALCVHCLDL